MVTLMDKCENLYVKIVYWEIEGIDKPFFSKMTYADKEMKSEPLWVHNALPQDHKVISKAQYEEKLTAYNIKVQEDKATIEKEMTIKKDLFLETLQGKLEKHGLDKDVIAYLLYGEVNYG